MTTTARIAVVSEAGADFAMEEREIADPGPHEVLIELVATGVCHTDLAVQAGDLPTNYPVVLGHEGAGKVVATGSHVTDIAKGDHVVLSYGSCGHCRPCQEGDPAYCADFNPLNFLNKRQGDDAPVFDDGPNAAFFQQSSFATYSIAHERNVVKIEADVDISLLGPLGCGIQTGAGAVMRTAQPPAGSSLLVSGVGSVGMAAVMGAKVAGCSPIIAVDTNEDRLTLAKELGATDTVHVTKGTDVPEAVRKIVAGGVDSAIECSGNATAARGVGFACQPGHAGGGRRTARGHRIFLRRQRTDPLGSQDRRLRGGRFQGQAVHPDAGRSLPQGAIPVRQAREALPVRQDQRSGRRPA